MIEQWVHLNYRSILRMRNFLKELRILDYIFALIVIVKIISFYLITNISRDSLLVGFITFLAIVITFYSCLFNKKKRSWIWFATMYTIISLIMVIDACYYSYFNQLISLNQLKQVDKLIVINDSFKFVAPPIGVLLILDAPFMGWYFVKLKKRIQTVDYTRFKKHKRFVVAAFYVILGLIVFNPFNADTVRAINHNEVLTYHIYDIYTNIFGEEDNIIESKEDVLRVIHENEGLNSQIIQYNGIGSGKNLIVIQVESLQDFVINKDYDGQEITPNLNQLLKETGTLYFDNYYETIGKGNTSDAEFSTLNSVYPNIEGSVYERYYDNTYHGLPWIMRDYGYYSMVYHGYKGAFWNREEAYIYQGFQDFKSEEDFVVTDTMGWGIVDEDMLKQSLDHMLTLPQPFFSFVITLSSHHPYLVPEHLSTIQINELDLGTVFGNYIEAIHYTDAALGKFIQDLKDRGLYESSIIALYGDHYALNCKAEENYERMTEFLGMTYDYDEMLNIPLIIHIPGSSSPKTIHTTGGEIDFLPTVANVMGVELNNPYIFGRDLLNCKDGGFVASVTFLFRGSFCKDGVMFEFSKDGIYEESNAINLQTKEVVRIDDYQSDYIRAKNLIDASHYVLENNLIERENQY